MMSSSKVCCRRRERHGGMSRRRCSTRPLLIPVVVPSRPARRGRRWVGGWMDGWVRVVCVCVPVRSPPLPNCAVCCLLARSLAPRRHDRMALCSLHYSSPNLDHDTLALVACTASLCRRWCRRCGARLASGLHAHIHACRRPCLSNHNNIAIPTKRRHDLSRSLVATRIARHLHRLLIALLDHQSRQ